MKKSPAGRKTLVLVLTFLLSSFSVAQPQPLLNSSDFGALNLKVEDGATILSDSDPASSNSTSSSSDSVQPPPPPPLVENPKQRILPIFFLPLLGAGADLVAEVLQNILHTPEERAVSVGNQCGNVNGAQLIVKCASGDDTIGPYAINNGNAMVFKFKTNVWGTTHFWCDVWWNGKWTVFPAYAGGAPTSERVNDFRVYGYTAGNYGVYIRQGSNLRTFKPWNN